MRDHRPEPGQGPPAWTIALALALSSLTAFGLGWLADDLGPAGTTTHRPSPLDALQPALLRCQRLGERALADPRCRAAWAEHRRHFLILRPKAEPHP